MTEDQSLRPEAGLDGGVDKGSELKRNIFHRFEPCHVHCALPEIHYYLENFLLVAYKQMARARLPTPGDTSQMYVSMTVHFID